MSQPSFDPPKTTRRNNSILFILFKQTLGDVEKIQKDNAVSDMRYDEFKDLFGDAWKDEEYKYLCFQRLKTKFEAINCIYIENRHEIYSVFIHESKPLSNCITQKHTKFPLYTG